MGFQSNNPNWHKLPGIRQTDLATREARRKKINKQRLENERAAELGIVEAPVEGMVCPKCYRGYDPGAKFCPHDSEKLVPYPEWRARSKGRH